jgi:peptide-methionine (S)-S-oxide reductase
LKTIEEVAAEGKYPGYPDKIVTEVKELEEFYPAEQYHQDYYNLNTTQGYCRAVIKPKLSKFASLFQKYIDSSRL